MKSVGSYEAKTHLPRLLSQVEKGEAITSTRRGRPVAILSPARRQPERDIRTVIDEFRA
jgi:prevent-host-death family protein